MGDIGVVGGNKIYKPNRKRQYHEPDVIFETDEYLLLIECKSTPFSLDLLKQREAKSLNGIEEDIHTSTENIDRYLDYKDLKNTNKKVIKFLVYFDAPVLSLGVIMTEIRKFVTTPDFYIMDIDSLELLLAEDLGSLPHVLKEYLVEYKKSQSDISTYLRTRVNFNAFEKDNAHIFEELMRDYVGLEKSKK